MNPYRENTPPPLHVGDDVEFIWADGFHLPYGTWRVNVVRDDGWVKVANGWSDPKSVKRVTSHTRVPDEVGGIE